MSGNGKPPVLVVLQLTGGNDFMNTVIPYTNPVYHDNRPTVEGWHTGKEWIDGGTLNERVNFAVNAFNDATKPGIQDIIERLRSSHHTLSPDELVDRCLDLIGPMEVGGDTRDGLLRYASAGGELRFDGEESEGQTATRVSRLLQLIVASRDYQFA